ncbi:putative transposase [Edaphobacter aggregans]|uniref:Putative transposase n=1 Tax=Edaphobacter aggregans TaxID=570835 RepID=A0A3R9NVU0_9BACT|nr:Mu transposase C-terminal domain-containing protein [Edaphobacter aggregans]RSL17970.1 putative transposase [Edaphobacter aggregans]
MATACLEQGTVVHIEGSEYRFSRKIDDCWQLEQSKTGRIVEYEQQDLLRMLAERKLTFRGSVPVSRCGPANCDLSPADLELAKLRRSYVMAVLNTPNSRKRLEEAIHDAWKRVRAPQRAPGWITVYRWKCRFLRASGDVRALVDDTRSKGNKQGRYPASVIERCEQSISNKYLNRTRNSIQQTLEDALYRVKKENELRPACDALPVPTRRLITRMIANIPAFDKHSARYGHDSAVKEFRGVKGQTVAQAPLERAEIDHTLLDLMVVDDRTGLPLGRPSVTACIDCYTRCILGIYIGFNPPSYQSVAACLKDCFLPKVNLKRDYPGIVNEWPAYGVMHNLVVDGGLEFYSASLEQVCLSLNINWIAAPRRTAWFKGKIERFLGTMNRAVAHGVPGTTFSNIFEKGDYNPAKHAVITLSTLRKVVRTWIADVYHQQVHRSLQTTPSKMWTSSIRPEDIRLPDETTQLDVVMGRVESRSLTHKGVEFEGLFYNSPELTELRRKEGANLKVEIRVNESDIGSIYVLSPKTSKAYSVPASDPDYAGGISLWQHKVIKNYQRQHSDTDHGVDGWLQAKNEVSHLIDESLKLKRARTHKRIARYRETPEQKPPKTQMIEATKLRTPAPISATTGSQMVDRGFRDSVQDQAGIPQQESAVPIIRPRFKAEIREIHED